MILDIRYKLILLISVIIILVSIFYGQAQNMKTKDADTWKYMHMLSPEEMNTKVKIERDFKVTVPPPAPVESLAEFEPMSGVLVNEIDRENFKNIIIDFTKAGFVYTMVHYNSAIPPLINQYLSWGIDTSRCKFIQYSYNTPWLRDLGPMFIAGVDSIAIVGFRYNKSLNSDPIFSEFIANECNYPYTYMDLVHTGGNYMTDGYGVAASTQIAYTENSISKEEVDQKVKDYLGIHTYHVLQDPNNTYINHIDCWGKFLDVDKILIRSVPSSHPQYNEIEATADYFKNQVSSWGNNYQVIRIDTPNDEPYTNSFILNKRVYVPIMGTEWDEPALDVYRKAMPGYLISGYYSNTWISTAALHCKVHEIADKQMVRIKHIPIRGAQGDKTDFILKATIKAYSGKPFKQDSVRLFFKVDFGEWQSTKMQQVSQDTFSVNLSAVNPNQTIQYYIYAADQGGKRATLPLVGGAAPFTFVTSSIFTQTRPNLDNPKIKIYPNPVQSWLCIDLGENEYGENIKTDVISSTGTILKTRNINHSGKSYIEFNDFIAGIYYIRIYGKEKTETYMIIKR